jgi:hypothetical protein
MSQNFQKHFNDKHKREHQIAVFDELREPFGLIMVLNSHTRRVEEYANKNEPNEML